MSCPAGEGFAAHGPRLPCLAFVLFATDGAVAERLGGDMPTRALASGHPDIVELWASRTFVALDGNPGLRGDCPSEKTLAPVPVQTHGTSAASPLIALHDRLRQLAPAV